jgi:hypothetical protein
MIFKDGKPSQFYQNYVMDVQAKIEANAAAEFSCIWREHVRLNGAKSRTAISDELSSALNNLQAELESSDLFEDVPSRRGVLMKAIPKSLVQEVGLETLMKRLPEAYQRALFSSWVGSNFVSILFGVFCGFLSLSCFVRCTSMVSMPPASISSISLVTLQAVSSKERRRCSIPMGGFALLKKRPFHRQHVHTLIVKTGLVAFI